MLDATPRRRLPPQERERQITAAAATLLAQRSAENITVAEIAQQADVSKALFYRHFSSVEEVLHAVVNVVVAAFLDRLGHEESSIPLEELEAIVLAYCEACAGVRPAARAILRNSRLPGTEIEGSVHAVVRSGAETELFRRLEVEEPTPLTLLTVRSWFSALEVQVYDWLGQVDPEPVRTMTRRLAATLLAMLAVVDDPQSRAIATVLRGSSEGPGPTDSPEVSR